MGGACSWQQRWHRVTSVRVSSWKIQQASKVSRHLWRPQVCLPSQNQNVGTPRTPQFISINHLVYSCFKTSLTYSNIFSKWHLRIDKGMTRMFIKQPFCLLFVPSLMSNTVYGVIIQQQTLHHWVVTQMTCWCTSSVWGSCKNMKVLMSQHKEAQDSIWNELGK